MTPEQKKQNYELAEKIIAQQSFRGALLFGTIAALLVIGAWLLVVVLSDRPATIMAIAVGAAVGYAIQLFGKGIEVKYAVLAALLTIITVTAGQIAAAIVYEVVHYATPLSDILAVMDLRSALQFLVADIDLIVIAFWIIAISIAAFIANRRLTHVEALAVFSHRYRDLDDNKA